jgi:hypothetical protein
MCVCKGARAWLWIPRHREREILTNVLAAYIPLEIIHMSGHGEHCLHRAYGRVCCHSHQQAFLVSYPVKKRCRIRQPVVAYAQHRHRHKTDTDTDTDRDTGTGTGTGTDTDTGTDKDRQTHQAAGGCQQISSNIIHQSDLITLKRAT